VIIVIHSHVVIFEYIFFISKEHILISVFILILLRSVINSTELRILNVYGNAIMLLMFCHVIHAINFHPLPAVKFPLNSAFRRFTDGPYKYQVSELRRNNEYTCESIQHIIKEINRKNRIMNLISVERNEYSNQLN
jgi:hypothetical protein